MANPNWVKGVSGNPAGKAKGVPSILAEMRRILRENPERATKLAESLLSQSEANPQFARQVLDRLEGPVANKLEVTQLSPEQAAELLRMDDQAREGDDGTE